MDGVCQFGLYIAPLILSGVLLLVNHYCVCDRFGYELFSKFSFIVSIVVCFIPILNLFYASLLLIALLDALFSKEIFEMRKKVKEHKFFKRDKIE